MSSWNAMASAARRSNCGKAWASWLWWDAASRRQRSLPNALPVRRGRKVAESFISHRGARLPTRLAGEFINQRPRKAVTELYAIWRCLPAQGSSGFRCRACRDQSGGA